MIKWLTLNRAQRLMSLQQTSAVSGITIKAIEKDWWVTLVLKAVFRTPYAPYLLFKGGTSLSKCWGLIDRFSEDIDLALDRDYFGEEKEWTSSKVKQLKKKACKFTSNELREAIEKELHALGVPPEMVTVSAAEVPATLPDKDPQELMVRYESVTEKIAYLDDVVKIEVSARSLKEPWKVCKVQSLLDHYLPDAPFREEAFDVSSVEPKRTFLEKVFLLHEEFQKEEHRIRSFRMSRHHYDLFRIKDTEHGKTALADDELYEGIVRHRALFSLLPWVNYELHQKATISFVPPEPLMKAYREDYETMATTMIYGDVPSFDQLMGAMKELTTSFRPLPPLPSGAELEALVQQAMQSDLPINAEEEGAQVSVFLPAPNNAAAAKKTKGYHLFFIRENGVLRFRKIEWAD